MEEEIKNEEKQEQPAKTESRKEIKLTAQVIIVCMAIVAMFLFVLWKILTNFGVINGIFSGIISIVIYGLSLTGLIWAYIRTKKPSFEFWLNVVVFGLAIWLLV